MAKVGEVLVEILADSKKLSSGVQSALSNISRNVDKTSANMAKSLGDAMTSWAPKLQKAGPVIQNVGSKLTNYITAPALGAAGAVTTLVSALGFKRLAGIDQARGQFQGLGYDAEKVMAQVDKGVTDTSLSMAQGASAAVGILATGSVPLEELENSIKRVANVSAAYNVDAEQAAYLLNNVLTKNKVTWGDLSQMQMNGIPIVTSLAEHYGVAGDAIMDMAQNGEISIEALNEALDSKAGDAAEAYAGTWNGITANIMSNLGKIGAKLMEPSFEILKEKAADLLEFLRSDELSAWADEWGEKIGTMVGQAADGIKRLIGWWQALSPEAQATIGKIAGAAIALGPVLQMTGKVTGAMGGLFEAVGPGLSVFGELRQQGMKIGPAFSWSFSGASKALSFMTGPAGIIIGLIAAMVAASPELRATLGEVFKMLAEVVGDLFKALSPVVQMLIDALVPVFKTLGDIVAVVIQALLPFVEILIGMLAPILEVLVALMQPLFTILEAVLTPIMALVGWIADLVGMLADWAGALANVGLKWFADIINTYVVPAIEWLNDIIDAAIGWFFDLFDSSTEQGQAMADFWKGVGDFFKTLWDGIVDVWNGIVGFFQGIWDGVVAVWEKVTGFFQTVWQGVVDVITWAWDTMIKPIIEAIAWTIDTFIVQPFNFMWDIISWVWEAVSTATQIMWALVSAIFQEIWNAIANTLGPIFEWIYESIVKPVWEGIQAVIDRVWKAIKKIWESLVAAIEWVGSIFEWLYNNVVKPVWENIQKAIEFAKDMIQKAFDAIEWALDKLATPFRWLYDSVIKPVWESIQNAIGAVSDWFQDTIVAGWQNAIDNIGGFFEGLFSVVDEVWTNIKKAAVAPVNFVLGTVYNDGIKAVFDTIAEALGLEIRMPKAQLIKLASGGVLPGYTPGRDVHRFYSPTAGHLWLSGGEAIMRPEFTRAVGGPRGIDALNAAARRGALGSAPSVGAFAEGGVVPSERVQKFADGGFFGWVGDVVGGVGSWLGDVAKNIGEVLANPGEAIKRMILDPISGWLDDVAANHGFLGQLLVGIPKSIVNGIIDWLTGQDGGDEWNGWIVGPTFWRLKPIIDRHNLTVSDTWGSPEYNRRLGRVPTSYHGDRNNPAIDFYGSWDNMVAAGHDVRRMGGWRQVLWQTAGHWDHLHVAKDGGVFNENLQKKLLAKGYMDWGAATGGVLDVANQKLYDSGGWLRPGMTMAVNASGRPEPVFTASQWETLSALVQRGGGGATIEEGAIQITGSADPRKTALEVLDAVAEKVSM